MHVVKCPKCQKVLQLNRAMQQAKFRCKSCGEVFVASTSEVAGGGASQGRPAANKSAAAPVNNPARTQVQRVHRPADPQEQAQQGAAFPQQYQQPQYAPPPQYPSPPQYAPPPQYGPPPGGGYYAPPPRQGSKATLIIVIILAVGIVGGIGAGIWFVVSHPTRHFVDAAGVPHEDRMTDAQYNATMAIIAAENKAAKDNNDKIAAAAAEAAAKRAAKLAARDGAAKPSAPGDSTTPGDTTVVKAPAAIAQVLKGDDKIAVQMDAKPRPGGAPGFGHVTGSVTNNYDVMLTEVKLTGQIVKGSDLLQKLEGTINNVPAHTTINFAIPYKDLSDMDDDPAPQAAVVAAGTKADDKTVCWMASDTSVQVQPPEGKYYVLRGTKVRNETGFALKDIRVYVDFYADQVYVGSASGPMEPESQSLGVGKSGSFTIRFDTGDPKVELASPRAVTSYSVRLIGKKS